VSTDERAPHSSEYFGDYRDYWWNRDFLAMLATLWDVHANARVLDVGSGLGHWTSTLAGILPSAARFVGVDPEPQWTTEAADRLSPPKFEFHTASAYALPFEQDEFDVATCQTVLIHLSEPQRALQEMLRVLRPGGLILAAEPSNQGGLLTRDSLTADREPGEETRRARFCLLCERGKRRLGEGDSSFGDLLPGVLTSMGVDQVTVRISDKAIPMIPPYETPEAQAMISQIHDWIEDGVYIWGKDAARRYFLAGGGAADDFEREWAFLLRLQTQERDAIEADRFSSAGGSLMYVVWGRKPRR
jgi:SAM-dependent methyltransferase